MEGPSLLLAAQQLQPLKGQIVLSVAGNTTLPKERFVGKEVKDIYSWGKHLIFQFESFAFRVHFLLFGTYEATVHGKAVTGDYKRSRDTRLTLEFPDGEIKMFNCSIKLFETSDLKSTYDYSIDIMSSAWDPKKALQQLKSHIDEEVADVLLDQTVFAGVGNIIKNEVLSLEHMHPKTIIAALSIKQRRDLIHTTQAFSHQFLEWRKHFVLRQHLKIHRKSVCPYCGEKVIREKTGKRNRWSYYCPSDQPNITQSLHTSDSPTSVEL